MRYVLAWLLAELLAVLIAPHLILCYLVGRTLDRLAGYEW